MPTGSHSSATSKLARLHPFRRAVLRGLGVVMPPLLTIVLFIWAWTTIDGYILQPMENAVRWVIVSMEMWSDVEEAIPPDTPAESVIVVDKRHERVPVEDVLKETGSVQGILIRARMRGWQVASFQRGGVVYVSVADQKWIPEYVYEQVKQQPGKLVIATATARDVYERYVNIRYLTRWRVIPVFLSVFIAVLYLLGKFLAAGAGRIFLTSLEAMIQRLPVVRNVYSAVKQVTDFFFSESEIEFNRVVAIQYPRKGIWSVGFVTGESMLDIHSAANEAVLSVLMPTSPMPATGFTVTVRKSEAIDLNITVDQAIQFIVSCGVVVPKHQQMDSIGSQISTAIAQRLQGESPEVPPSQVQALPGYATAGDVSQNGDDQPEPPPDEAQPPQRDASGEPAGP